MGKPFAFSPFAVYLMPSSRASIVRVWLFGAGPGLYLDLSRLSFQVPTLLSAPHAITVRANTASMTLEVKKSLLRMFLLLCAGIIPRGAAVRAPAFWRERILDVGDVEEGGARCPMRMPRPTTPDCMSLSSMRVVVNANSWSVLPAVQIFLKISSN